MRLLLDTFARQELQARLGDDVAVGVRAALEHYARRLESGESPPDFPRFRREGAAEGAGAEVEVSIEPGIQEALETEARRSGVPIERLAAHAVFVYLADLDRASEENPAPDSSRIP